MIATARKHAAFLIPRIQEVSPQHAAILPSEMLAFCAMCLEQGVIRVVESGRRYGYSTDVLSRMPWETVSIENSPEAEYDSRLDNVTLLKGNGEQMVPLLVGAGTAVLLDGPKGLKAWALFQQIRNKIVLCGIHDVYRGTQIRDMAAGAFFTDQQEFVDEFGWLDAEMFKMRGFTSHSELFSGGNVLAILAGGH